MEETVEFQLLTDSDITDDGKVEFIVETSENSSEVQQLEKLLSQAKSTIERLRFENKELRNKLNESKRKEFDVVM